MHDKLSADQFKKLIDTDVKVIVMNGPNLTLKLEDINEGDFKCDAMPEGCRAKPFSLALTGPGHYQVADGVYDLTFEKLGTMSGIFLAKKGPRGAGKDAEEKTEEAGEAPRTVYEIVFS